MAKDDNNSKNQRRGSGLIGRIFVSLIGTILVISIIANIYFALILAQLTGGIHETTYRKGNADSRIVIMPISGTIDSSTAKYVRKSLKEFKDNLPRAIVLRVDSGGGAVGPSDQVHHMFAEFNKKHPDIPIVSSYGQVAASGAYYLSVGSNYIFAEPTTVTGSIGVMAPIFTFGNLLQKIGVKPVWLHAKGSPDKLVGNNPTQKQWSDQDKQEIRKLLDDDYNRFAKVVYQGRSKSPAKATKAEINKVAQGRVYTASEAKKFKLIDSIGYIDDALDKAARLAHIPKDVKPQVTVVKKPGSFSLIKLFTGASFDGGSKLDSNNFGADKLRSIAQELITPRREYRAIIR